MERRSSKKLRQQMSTTSKIKDSIGNLFHNSTYKLDCNKHKKEIRKILKSMKGNKTKKKKMLDLLKKGGKRNKTRRRSKIRKHKTRRRSKMRRYKTRRRY